MAEELKACPFCGQSDFLIERLDNCSSVVICQGMVDEHSACLAQGPVAIQDDDGEEQPGRDAAIREWNTRAQLPSQGGEAVAAQTRFRLPQKGSPDWSPWHETRVSESQPARCIDSQGFEVEYRLLYTHPADQVADDLTMVKASRELLQDLRDLAFDQVEHHRAAMGAYKQTRQSAMDSVLAQADALLRS